MLFQSPQFLVFFCCFFTVYWALRRRTTLQNLLTLIGSYVFYGWWDWRLLGLIGLTSLFDFLTAIRIDTASSNSVRRRWMQASLFFNLSILGFFKYYNFFAAELQRLLNDLGVSQVDLRLNILLPVGISFYTFQTLSYTVDVYHRRLPATRDPVVFFTYIAFFPQLVAGPIERAEHLIPQFSRPRHFDYGSGVAAARLILWGFFKKLAVADNCAPFVDHCFDPHNILSGWLLLAGSAAFAFQIYGDFSGYSDIARGTAGLLGIRLMKNFEFPYFSQSPAQFWRRWHISLGTWFRDYVYIPLGGARINKRRQTLNTLVVFALSGLWHGAAWTFVVWGLLNGLLVVSHRAGAERDYGRTRSLLPSLAEASRIMLTFSVILPAWVFFRAETVEHAVRYLQTIAGDVIRHPGGIGPAFRWLVQREIWLLPVIVLLFLEWLSYRRIAVFDSAPRLCRWALYLAVLSLVTWTAFCRPASDFLYFQF